MTKGNFQKASWYQVFENSEYITRLEPGNWKHTGKFILNTAEQNVTQQFKTKQSTINTITTKMVWYTTTYYVAIANVKIKKSHIWRLNYHQIQIFTKKQNKLITQPKNISKTPVSRTHLERIGTLIKNVLACQYNTRWRFEL